MISGIPRPAVRAATECLTAPPVEEIEVVMQADLPDRGSGPIGAEPALWLRATVQAWPPIALPHTDAAPLVERLAGHWDWSRKEGFRRSAWRRWMCRKLRRSESFEYQPTYESGTSIYSQL